MSKKTPERVAKPGGVAPTDSSEVTGAGVPLQLFKTAVDVFVTLRDEAKFLVFHSRRNSTRLIGREEDFIRALGEVAGDHEPENLEKAFRELKVVVANYGWLPKQPEVVLEFSRNEKHFPGLNSSDPNTVGEVKRIIRQKIEYASSKIATPLLLARHERLATSVGACLEELDADVVIRRVDELKAEDIGGPFLRLRIRHSAPAPDSPFGLFAIVSEPVASLEIDCDESDIDFLIQRLISAKRVLGEATSRSDLKSGDAK